MIYYTGLDLHRKYAQIVTLDESGNIVKEGKVDNSQQAFTDFFSQKPYYSATEHKLVLEPTSFWYPCYEILENLNIEVHLANPVQVKAIASARIKTDRIDAKILAHLLRCNLLPEAYIPPKSVRYLKELVRCRVSLIRMRTQIKNKIHSLLHKNSIRHEFSDLFGRKGLEYLQNLSLPPTFQTIKEHYLSVYYDLTEQIKIVSEIIKKKALKSRQAQLLTTIDGIGYFMALLILSEIGDINRFPTPKHLHSYAGIVPSVYSSGGKTRTGRITKQGSSYLRWAFVEVGQRQGQFQSKIGAYYRKIKAKKGTKTAKVACARKIATAVFVVLKKNEPYQPFLSGQEDTSFRFCH